MRKILGLTLCFVFLSASVAWAEVKVAVFELQSVAAKCEAVKAAQAELKKKFDGQKKQLEKDRAALEKKAEGFKGKQPTQQQQADFIKQQREYSEKANAYVRAVQQDELRVRKEIDALIMTASKDLAKRKGFNLVLDSSAALYFDSSMDITNDMLDETNRVWREKKK